jgi:uncharacterized integral membrane protein (TIGR00698 family)
MSAATTEASATSPTHVPEKAQRLERHKAYHNLDFLNGLWLSASVAMAAMWITEIPWMPPLSPLLLALLIGATYGNTLKGRMPGEWAEGVHYATRQVLRTAIVLYGFRLTISDIAAMGWAGVTLDAFMVVSTIGLGMLVGTKLLKMDPEMTAMCSAGAGICGAAAVLATTPIVRGGHAKTAVAVASVVVFGTLAMLLYPLLWSFGWLGFDEHDFGVYLGATVHEVAQVVAASAAIGPQASDAAVTAKMGRVLFLAPVLLLGAALWSRIHTQRDANYVAQRPNIPIPWFAVIFVGTMLFNSAALLPAKVVSSINALDTFLLCVAMAALGIETTWERIRSVGPKPFMLAGILAVWLVLGGGLAAKLLLA